MKKLKYLVIHCTDTPAGREVTADEIIQWHTAPKPQGNGWRKVGYRLMFQLDGTQLQLAPNYSDGYVEGWEITNGAAGYNSVSEHWVYVGGKGCDTRTDAQITAMKDAVLAFHKQFPDVLIVGHNYLNPGKACPSFDVQKWLESIGIKQIL